MKKFNLTICLVIASISLTYAQINLFGVNISSYLSSTPDTEFKKIECTKNCYFTGANYQYYPEKKMKFIMFTDAKAGTKTPQMQNPKEYLNELGVEVSKALGLDSKVYGQIQSSSSTNDQYYWIVKEGNNYIITKLTYSEHSQTNNLRVFIFDANNELAKGFESLTKDEGKDIALKL